MYGLRGQDKNREDFEAHSRNAACALWNADYSFIIKPLHQLLFLSPHFHARCC
jgi:hypothetical protein